MVRARGLGALFLACIGSGLSQQARPIGEGGMRGRAASRSLASSTVTDCSDEVLACEDDSTCLSCISSGNINTAECLTMYPSSSGSESSFCHTLASSYCCAAYSLLENSLSCTDSELVINYWACTLAANGCTIDDLPCESEEGSETEPSQTISSSTSNEGDANSTAVLSSMDASVTSASTAESDTVDSTHAAATDGDGASRGASAEATCAVLVVASIIGLMII